MGKKLFWLSASEWARVEPHLPRGRPGARRVDDRRVISGIIHMLKTGARWRDCPSEYGPYTTIYNRFNRWSKQGIWEDVFYALSGSSGVIGSTAVDSTHIKGIARQPAQKGGLRTRHRPLARRTVDQNSRHNRSGRAAAGLRHHPRSDP